MKSRITLKDIAEELNVAVSTVSKALRDSPEISKETRERIKAYANYYNYKPNSLALKLRNQKTLVIGIIIPEIVHHFFSKVISGIENIANEKGYATMICLSNESFEKEKLNVDMLAGGNVDGILASLSKETLKNADFNHFKKLEQYDIPLVLFDRVTDEIQCDKVTIDDMGGAYKATKHLIETGCERIAILSTPDHVNVGALRKKGYIKALRDSGKTADERFIVKVDESTSITEQIEHLFDNSNELPDGVVAVNEIYAAVAMKIARRKKIAVPNDMAIIAFTDGLISEFSNPSLSTVHQYGFTMGELAAELLLNRIQSTEDEEKKYENKVISTDIIIRKSTKK